MTPNQTSKILHENGKAIFKLALLKTDEQLSSTIFARLVDIKIGDLVIEVTPNANRTPDECVGYLECVSHVEGKFTHVIKSLSGKLSTWDNGNFIKVLQS